MDKTNKSNFHCYTGQFSCVNTHFHQHPGAKEESTLQMLNINLSLKFCPDTMPHIQKTFKNISKKKNSVFFVFVLAYFC